MGAESNLDGLYTVTAQVIPVLLLAMVVDLRAAAEKDQPGAAAIFVILVSLFGFAGEAVSLDAVLLGKSELWPHGIVLVVSLAFLTACLIIVVASRSIEAAARSNKLGWSEKKANTWRLSIAVFVALSVGLGGSFGGFARISDVYENPDLHTSLGPGPCPPVGDALS